MGPFDVTVLFQKGGEIAPGQFALVDQVAVTFSPQHFKALVNSLAAALEAYENTFGKLAIPEADTAPLKSAAELTAKLQEVRRAALSAKEQTPF
jgi:hypothetical protein